MLCSIVSHAQIRYVKPVASGSGNGSSWANASSDLQAMINASPAGEEIWIAAGTYKPNRRADATGTITLNNRNNAFVLKEGVELYGGFIGTELFKHHRNYLLNIVILSGDIGIVGVSTDNCYHVVVSSGNTYQTVFDGITVQRGMANGASSITVNTYPISQKSGGGIYSMMDNVSFTNCIIQNNEALNTGGGLYDSLKAGGQSGYHTNCIITGNIAGSKGGGVYMGLAFGGLYDCDST